MEGEYNMRCVVRNRVATRLIAKYCFLAVNDLMIIQHFLKRHFLLRLESHHVANKYARPM